MEGLKGLFYNGDTIAFADITDELAEKLEGKTHVLKRKVGATVAPVVAIADRATAEPAAEEAPAATSKRK